MSLFTSPPKPPTTASPDREYDRKWLQHSAERWRDYYNNFLYDIELTDAEGLIMDRIRRAALAADEALKQEQERWGRAVVDA